MTEDLWERIWEERGRDYPEDDPARIAGYDRPYSTKSPEAVAALTTSVVSKLELTSSDDLLDVGCGAGLLLHRLAPMVRKAVGTDRARSLVERTKKLYPHLNVVQADATRLPFADGTFSKVLMNGVIFYFPDVAYATRALDEILRVCAPRCRVMVGDVPDPELRDQSDRMREQAAAGSEPVWKSSVDASPEHLYLDRSYFATFAAERGLACSVHSIDVRGYANGAFRYDVVLSR